MSEGDRRELLTRRQVIAGAGVGALALAAGAFALLRDGGSSSPPATTGATQATEGPATAAERAACVLTPEQTEGPYYLDGGKLRSNVVEDREGVPLELVLTVQDAYSCEPVGGATVEIWHCDALGAYSGVQGAGGETFLRGGQRTDRSGRVTFETIYPGWYQGRTTHIHVKVHVRGDEVHTGQLYFEDELTSSVASESPYSSRGEPDTTNASDGIYARGGRESTVSVERSRSGYVGRLALGVRA